MLGKWLVRLAIILGLSVSLFWGWKMREELTECRRINQDLMEEIKKGAYPGRSGEKRFLEEGDSLESFPALISLEGQTVSLDLNRVWLVIFISTSCPACVEMALDVLVNLNEYLDRGLEIVSVSRDIIENLNELVRSKYWNIPVLRDNGGKLYRLFGVSAEPYFVLVEKGRVRFKSDAMGIGRRRGELESQVKAALGI